MFIARAIVRLSSLVAAIERPLLALLIAAIAVFVLMNVLLRMIGVTIAWADEIAIYSMVLSGFVGASLMLRGRIDPAVLLLHELLPRWGVQVLRVIISIVALGFGITMVYLCWRWFNPPGLIAAGFDVATFEGATFNFIYTDTTPVMGASAFWFYLVVPWFGITLSIHAAANLMEDIGAVERVANPIKVVTSEV